MDQVIGHLVRRCPGNVERSFCVNDLSSIEFTDAEKGFIAQAAFLALPGLAKKINGRRVELIQQLVVKGEFAQHCRSHRLDRIYTFYSNDLFGLRFSAYAHYMTALFHFMSELIQDSLPIRSPANWS